MVVQGILCRALAGGDGLSAVGGGWGAGLARAQNPSGSYAASSPFRGALGGCGAWGGGAGGFCVLIFSMQWGYRPPGAIFFLLRRRKNMERKTPRRAGGPPPYEPTPLGGCRWCGWLVRATRQICECIRALIAGVRAACRFAVAYALRWELDGFFAGLHPLAFQRKRLPRRRLAS